MKALFKKMDEITVNWQRLETLLSGVEIESDYLTIDRFHGKMRLLYKAKPIGECSVEEKIEAANCIEQLYINYMLKYNNLYKRADEANKLLVKWLINFEEIINGKESNKS